MAAKRHKPEEIVTKSRQVEVLVGQSMARIDAIRQVCIPCPDAVCSQGQKGLNNGTEDQKSKKHEPEQAKPEPSANFSKV